MNRSFAKYTSAIAHIVSFIISVIVIVIASLSRKKSEKDDDEYGVKVHYYRDDIVDTKSTDFNFGPSVKKSSDSIPRIDIENELGERCRDYPNFGEKVCQKWPSILSVKTIAPTAVNTFIPKRTSRQKICY